MARDSHKTSARSAGSVKLRPIALATPRTKDRANDVQVQTTSELVQSWLCGLSVQIGRPANPFPAGLASWAPGAPQANGARRKQRGFNWLQLPYVFPSGRANYGPKARQAIAHAIGVPPLYPGRYQYRPHKREAQHALRPPGFNFVGNSMKPV